MRMRQLLTGVGILNFRGFIPLLFKVSTFFVIKKNKEKEVRENEVLKFLEQLDVS